MLPRWHIVLGILFTILLAFIAPGIKISGLALIFLSSVLIDLDHYLASIMKTRKFGLKSSFDYYKKVEKQLEKDKKNRIRKKYDFHFFHTLEFHILIALLGILYSPFFYIFIGMTFHSLLDIYDLMKKDRMHAREFFFINWIRNKFLMLA